MCKGDGGQVLSNVELILPWNVVEACYTLERNDSTCFFAANDAEGTTSQISLCKLEDNSVKIQVTVAAQENDKKDGVEAEAVGECNKHKEDENGRETKPETRQDDADQVIDSAATKQTAKLRKKKIIKKAKANQENEKEKKVPVLHVIEPLIAESHDGPEHWEYPNRDQTQANDEDQSTQVIYTNQHSEQHAEVNKTDLVSVSNHKCSQCEQVFSERRGLIDHINCMHNTTQDFMCDKCSMVFSSKGSLVRHRYIHGEQHHVCKFCGKGFHIKDNMNKHIRIVHEKNNGKMWKCSYCSKEFLVKGNMTQHIRAIHLKQFSFNCSKCQKGFRRLRDMMRHTVKCNEENDNIEMFENDSKSETPKGGKRRSKGHGSGGPQRSRSERDMTPDSEEEEDEEMDDSEYVIQDKIVVHDDDSEYTDEDLEEMVGEVSAN